MNKKFGDILAATKCLLRDKDELRQDLLCSKNEASRHFRSFKRFAAEQVQFFVNNYWKCYFDKDFVEFSELMDKLPKKEQNQKLMGRADQEPFYWRTAGTLTMDGFEKKRCDCNGFNEACSKCCGVDDIGKN